MTVLRRTRPSIDFWLEREYWNVAGNGAGGVVQAALELFGQTMRPRLAAQTTADNTHPGRPRRLSHR